MFRAPGPRDSFNTIMHWLRLDRLDSGDATNLYMQRPLYSEDNAWSVESLLGTGKSMKSLALAFDGQQDDDMLQGMCVGSNVCSGLPFAFYSGLVHICASPRSQSAALSIVHSLVE